MLDNIALLCPPCHAQETERQEQAGAKSAAWLVSRFSSNMMQLFRTTPRPRRFVWGDSTAQEWLRSADGLTLVQCLDVTGCGSNVLMERQRPLPIGCPLDDVKPVVEDGYCTRPLQDFEWLWVDLYEQVDGMLGSRMCLSCTDAMTAHTCTHWRQYSTSSTTASSWQAPTHCHLDGCQLTHGQPLI